MRNYICLTKISLIILFLISLIFGGKKEDIEKLLVLTKSEQLGTHIINQMVTSYKETIPNVPSKFWEEFTKEVDLNELKNLLYLIYDKYFTGEEIKGLILFYQSPIGSKFIEKLPIITQESMEVGGQWGKKLGVEVVKRLRVEGYISE